MSAPLPAVVRERSARAFSARLAFRGVRGLAGDAVLAFGAYALLAFLYLGLRLLVDPGNQFLGSGSDPKAFIWSFGWWPHAILHGLNPFVTRAIWAPSGLNLVWTASVPGLALLFSPVTLLAVRWSPTTSPASCCPRSRLGAGFLLCRYLTHAFWPSFVGGYVFGFSSYVLGQEEGHSPHTSAVFVLPLVALVAIRYVRGEIDGRGAALRLFGPLLGLEFLVSTEVSFTLALALATGIALGCAFVSGRRRRIALFAVPLAAGYAFAAVLIAPFVYYAIAGFKSVTLSEPWLYVTDLLNFVGADQNLARLAGLGAPISAAFPRCRRQRGAYLGLPALTDLVLFAGDATPNALWTVPGRGRSAPPSSLPSAPGSRSTANRALRFPGRWWRTGRSSTTS